MSKRSRIFLVLTLVSGALAFSGFLAGWNTTWNMLFAVFILATVASVLYENANSAIY